MSTLVTAAWGADFTLTALVLHGYRGAPGPRWPLALAAATGLVPALVLRDWAAAGFCAATLALLGHDWRRRRGAGT